MKMIETIATERISKGFHFGGCGAKAGAEEGDMLYMVKCKIKACKRALNEEVFKSVLARFS